MLCNWDWETVFTCLYPFTVQTRPLAGTASGMASDSVRSRYALYRLARFLYVCVMLAVVRPAGSLMLLQLTDEIGVVCVNTSPCVVLCFVCVNTSPCVVLCFVCVNASPCVVLCFVCVNTSPCVVLCRPTLVHTSLDG